MGKITDTWCSLHNPDKPIFTLPVPRSRIYIVTDPSLATAVQRASKTLSFTPLVPDITRRVLGLDHDTDAIVRQHIDPEPGQPRGFLADMHDMVYSYLGPGPALDELSHEAVRELASQVDTYAGALLKEKRGEGIVSLLPWIRHFVAFATANLLYGEENPFSSHPELESAFWDFDHGLGSLLTGVFPSITARKAYRGREALAAALEEYLVGNRHLPGEGRKGASQIVHKRVAIALQHGWTLRAAARSELSFLFAGIVNTATTTFWMVLHLFASASSGADSLLSTVRSELASCFIADPQARTLTLSLDKLKTSSPTLQSLFRECLRQNSDTYSTRLVKTATVLSGPGGPYHLAANSIVQISGGTMHSDPRIWGPDVRQFNPLRFLPKQHRGNQREKKAKKDSDQDENKEQEQHPKQHDPNTDNNNNTRPLKPRKGDSPTSSTSTTRAANRTTTKDDATTTTTHTTNNTPSNSSTIHPAAFRAFGGGKTLCPGRHFATVSIQALVALLVTKFDIVGPGEGEQSKTIEIPEKEDRVLPVHVLEPRREVRVKVRVRDARRVVVI
jgi:cytochrome P450